MAKIPIMQNPLIIGCIVFLVLLAGAFASWTIRQRLPEHHLTEDTKSLVVKRASLGHDRFNKAGPFVHQSPLQFPREGLGSIDGNGRHAKSFADLHPV